MWIVIFVLTAVLLVTLFYIWQTNETYIEMNGWKPSMDTFLRPMIDQEHLAPRITIDTSNYITLTTTDAYKLIAKEEIAEFFKKELGLERHGYYIVKNDIQEIKKHSQNNNLYVYVNMVVHKLGQVYGRELQVVIHRTPTTNKVVDIYVGEPVQEALMAVDGYQSKSSMSSSMISSSASTGPLSFSL